MIRWFLPNIASALDRLSRAVAELYLCTLELLRLRLMLRVASRPADERFGSGGKTRLMRWYLLPKNPFLNVCLHFITASDPAAEYHGHRWGYVSLILRGAYVEHREGKAPARLHAGSIAVRSRRTRHRVELLSFGQRLNHPRVWSLIVTGPLMRGH